MNQVLITPQMRLQLVQRGGNLRVRRRWRAFPIDGVIHRDDRFCVFIEHTVRRIRRTALSNRSDTFQRLVETDIRVLVQGFGNTFIYLLTYRVHVRIDRRLNGIRRLGLVRRRIGRHIVRRRRSGAAPCTRQGCQHHCTGNDNLTY